jgi:hypothetical protein
MNNNLKNVFTKVYDNKEWGYDWEGELTYSGPGSTKKYTENLRIELPKVYEKFNIKSVFDAPCGDLHWMNLVIDNCPDVKYIGGDIVKSLVDTNIQKYGKLNVDFVELDITIDSFPNVDLMICRDCLFHLPLEEIFKFLNNFIKSDIKYLLTTGYPTGDNRNIPVGGWFNIDLRLPPFNFSKNYLYEIEDWIPGELFPVRYMYMWDRNQIKTALISSYLNQFIT